MKLVPSSTFSLQEASTSAFTILKLLSFYYWIRHLDTSVNVIKHSKSLFFFIFKDKYFLKQVFQIHFINVKVHRCHNWKSDGGSPPGVAVVSLYPSIRPGSLSLPAVCSVMSLSLNKLCISVYIQTVCFHFPLNAYIAYSICFCNTFI